MIIGIDGNEANVDRRVGIGEYSFELLRQFSKYQISNIKYTLRISREKIFRKKMKLGGIG